MDFVHTSLGPPRTTIDPRDDEYFLKKPGEGGLDFSWRDPSNVKKPHVTVVEPIQRKQKKVPSQESQGAGKNFHVVKKPLNNETLQKTGLGFAVIQQQEKKAVFRLRVQIEKEREMDGRYHPDYKLNPKWDLLGLDVSKKFASGKWPYFWTPLPLGLDMATCMKTMLEFLEPAKTAAWKVHNPMAGAGGVTIACALAFGPENVSAGDYCPSQLAALKTNLENVNGGAFKAVQVDEGPVNVCDLSGGLYDAVVIDPMWGGLKYKTEANLDLFVKTGIFREADMDDVAMVLDRPAKWRVDPADTIPLYDLVNNVLSQNPGVKVVSVILPFNLSWAKFLLELHVAGYTAFSVNPGLLLPREVSAEDVKNWIAKGCSVTADDLDELDGFPKYLGPDSFLLVVRQSDLVDSMKRRKVTGTGMVRMAFGAPGEFRHGGHKKKIVNKFRHKRLGGARTKRRATRAQTWKKYTKDEWKSMPESQKEENRRAFRDYVRTCQQDLVYLEWYSRDPENNGSLPEGWSEEDYEYLRNSFGDYDEYDELVDVKYDVPDSDDEEQHDDEQGGDRDENGNEYLDSMARRVENLISRDETIEQLFWERLAGEGGW